MAYSLADSYVGDAFINGFNWFNGADPSNGYVRYQSQPDAESLGIYSILGDGTAIFGVDSDNVYDVPGGRPSVRLESKTAYNHGLFIGDFSHMPPSTCGLWPAFWMYGPDWPNNGEIDIIEGANRATRNIISAHTSDGCEVPRYGIDTTGEAIRWDCTSPGTNNNAGCSFLPSPFDTATYGDTFNAVRGGVYAMEWTSEDIKIWHWPRHSIPSDVHNKQPDPESWGPPSALFGTSTCEPDRYFRDMSIVLQTNFCGDYAGQMWRDSTCSHLAETCEEYVANNPEVFSDAYWEVNHIDVYERSHAPKPPPYDDDTTATTTMERTSTVYVTLEPNPTRGPGPHRPGRDPANIEEFAYLGCYASENGFPTFRFAEARDDMTPQLCVEACHGHRFAATHADQCLCADSIDPRARALADLAECDIPCPGNSRESCGGFLSENMGGFSVSPLRNVRRKEGQIHRPGSDFLISLYGIVGGRDEKPEPAPPLGEKGYGPGKYRGHQDADVVTIPYVTVCPTDHAKLITTEYCYTKTKCADECPEPPMETFVEKCEACGPHGESEVTLTVPKGPAGPTSPPTDGEADWEAPPADRKAPEEPAKGPPPEIWSPPAGSQPTGFVEVDGGVVLSMGVAIALPIAVAILRLVM